MDSPQSDDERLHEAGAGEAMLSKKMKLLIIMLSLVLIILLLPLASNHGLPLLKPMGMSMLQRLWDAMRFIAMTAAISVGIISTSSQRNEKGSDRSAHLRSTSSTRRSSAPIASSSREPINPNMINNFDMNRSGPPYLHQVSRGNKEMDSSQKSKGKEVMNDFSTAASSSDALSHASREEEIYGSGSPSMRAHSRLASNQEENYEKFKQRPMHSRHRLSASDAWSPASRIDEEIEEEYVASESHDQFSSGKSPGESRIESQKKSPPTIDEKVLMSSSKEIKSAERSFMNVYASMTDDNYAELRMRKAAISRLAEETHDANGKGHRRSSSVDRRRPIYYDDQGPDRPGLKQILMDVSKERASSSGKLSNLSPGNPDSNANRNMSNVRAQPYRPHPTQASIGSTPNIASTPSIQQSIKASVRHHPSTEIVKHSSANSMRSKVVSHEQQEGTIKMGANQILQKEAKMGPNEMVQSKQGGRVIEVVPNQIRHKQDDANMSTNQKMQADQATNQIVQRQDDYQSKVGTNQIVQKQDHQQAKVGINQTLQKQDDAKMKTGADAVSAGVQMPYARMARRGDEYNQEDLKSTMHKANMSSRSKLLLQSSKHSRSALNLEQLEQTGNTLHAKPPAGSSAKKKKSFSLDFGDGFSPDWLWELEPPPPPGFIDQQSVLTGPTEANLSKSKPSSSSSNLVQSLVPWRSSVPIDISAYPRAASPVSPPDMLSQATGPSPGEVNRRADEFINNFHTRLIKQRQESLERQRNYN